MKKIIVKEIRYMMSDNLEAQSIERMEKRIKLFGRVVYKKLLKNLISTP